MREKVLPCFLGLALGAATFVAEAFTTESVPTDGVYKFTFGVSEAQDGSIPVSADAVCDVKDETLESGKFSYGFLGTTDTSYIDDIPWSLGEPRAIDGFSVVSGQKILLRNAADKNGVSCVAGPAKSEYHPAGASDYEGRYPIRFAMRGEEYAYYAVTCTVANASSTANADVTLFSERSHIIAHHLSLAPGETKTFAWSVELAPNVFKTQGTYHDDCVNVCVVGENAALASLTVVKQPQIAGTVRGETVEKMNVGRTMWLCTDSTGTDQPIAIPFFSLQNYAGVGSGLSRWAPANLSIRNQGEGGLNAGSNAHRESCLLKPGDYLYVEYGHNHKSDGPAGYKSWLDTYLEDVDKADANLIIVSPVERRLTWNDETSTWERSLKGYAEVGEAWVEEKIAAGKTNVAFVDLNKRYNDWMNTELRRIHDVNPAISLNGAISFYYRSAKGAHVDDTHINSAGADQAAYLVWREILDRIDAAKGDDATLSQKIQAQVLQGVAEGCQMTVGIDSGEENSPWYVSDDIVMAGLAPNAYWDTPVASGFSYANDATVAKVEATANPNGTVTISGVTMRVLNPGNYYKAVVEVVNPDGSSSKYYSYSNYDVGGTGAISGMLVDPADPGFITSDKKKDEVTSDDIVGTLTVPANGKAYVWIAEVDGNWQVGENAPCSAKYPVEWWSDVIFDNDCSSLDGWIVNSQAVNEYSLSDKGGIYFMSAGANADNTKKNYGFYHQFDNTAQMANGRYRVSFKVMMDSGHITWQLFNSLGTTTTPFNGTGTTFLDISGTALTSYAGTVPLFTLDDDDAPQNIVNKLRWIDVDVIIDRDNDRAWVSVGGSDYVEYQNASFLPGGYAGTTWKYFGISCESQMSSYGYVDDVKIVKLASVEYPTVTAAAAPSDASMGSVTINGYETDELAIYSGNDFMIRATSADPDFYVFQNWTDDDGNVVSTDANLFIDNASENISLTANFREYADDENRVTTWDFSAYQGDFEVTASGATTVQDNGMTFYLTNGDTITADGLVWKDSAISKNTDTLGGSAHHIEFTPAATGTLTLKFSVDSYTSSRKPTMLIKAADSAGECGSGNGDVTVVTAAAGTEYTLSANLTAGTKYFIWTYAYNWSAAGFHHNYTIPSITYTYIPVFDATFDVADGETSVRANAIANNANVTKSGTGTLVLLGNSDFSGSLFVNAGTLKLGTPTDIPGATADFDVSAENAVETINEVLTWKDSLPGSENTLVNAGVRPEFVEEASTMNGRPALKGASFRMDMDSAISAKTTILAMHPFCGTTSWNVLMVDDESYSITCRNSSPWNRKGSGNKDYYGTDGIWQNGVDVDGKTQTTPMVMSIVGQWTKSDPACINIGWNNSSGTQAYSELLTYSRELAEAERVAVEEYLMSKWGIGNVAYAPIPASAGVEIATGATLDLGGMTQTVASLSVAVGGVVTNGTLIVASAPSIDEQAFAAATDNGDGTWTVVWKDVDIEVDTHSFVWNWNVASGDWNNPANWLYEGKVQANDYPKDAAEDYATFNTAAKVNLGAGASAKEVWLNDAVTFTNGTLTASLVTKYEDDGQAILANAGFANPKNLAATISCPIVMAADTVNWFNKVADGDWKEFMVVSGNISGSGRYNVNIANVQGNAIHFTGNNNEFYGDVYTSGGKSNRSVIRWGDDSVGTNTFLHIGHSYGTYNSDDYRMGAAVKFGGVDGGWWDRYDGALLTIGYLNRDSTINISNGVDNPYRANSVKKVGTANLTLGTTRIKNLTIEGGSVTMPVGIAPQTLTIATGTKIYLAGDAAWTAGTVTNLFSYTTLAGTGAGTLAEQVEVTGLAEGLVAKITVEDNTVTATIEAAEVAPTTDDENATITENGDGTYTVEVEAETIAITVPDGVTVREVVVSPNTATVTGVPENATVKVAVSWTDAQETQHSAAYAIVKVNSETGAVSLDENAVVTVGEEDIPLKPLIAAADAESEPFEVSDDVSVGVKSIPGLVYRLARGMTPDGIDTAAAKAVAQEAATSSRVSLTDEEPPAGAAFYRVTVDVK